MSGSDSFKNAIERLRAECEKSHVGRVALSMKTQNDPDSKIHELRSRISSEFLVRSEVDAACRHWIAKGNWPKPKHPETVVCYWDRIFHALQVSGWLYSQGFQLEKDENSILELFLISSWPVFGEKFLRASLQSRPH